jgi:hypothetical protein
LSGRLATDACRRATGVAVRTEYFARGTAPTDPCQLHRSDMILALVPPSIAAPPAPVAGRAAPPPVQSASGTTAATPAPEPATGKKKRGFWARVFGIGGDKKDQKDRRK